MIAGGFEGALKPAALIDLARRLSSEIRGSKARWATAATLINSLGAVPIAYFSFGAAAGVALDLPDRVAEARASVRTLPPSPKRVVMTAWRPGSATQVPRLEELGTNELDHVMSRVRV
jgi:hypothetical protein